MTLTKKIPIQSLKEPMWYFMKYHTGLELIPMLAVRFHSPALFGVRIDDIPT